MKKDILYDWYQEFMEPLLYEKTTKGYHRILHNIITKKNKKIVDKACKFLVKEQGYDEQIVGFLKDQIADKFSDWAAEEYNDDLMGC